jgi:HD-like signal output (HDOD) protein
MNPSVTATIRQRVQKIETMPTIPAVFLPLLNLLSGSAENTSVDEVVRLVSYDNAIAAQCLRAAASPLFGLSHAPQSIKSAVVTLGLRRVETILLTCCMSSSFPVKHWVLDPTVFWKHSLGCAMVCRKFGEKIASVDREQAYTAGLLHDLGVLVNCLAFPGEFAAAVELARRDEMPLEAAERASMGFTHCETGGMLAEQWKMSDDIVAVISHHHALPPGEHSPLVALVHLSDLLCRMRGMGYGYYERQKVDLVADPAWTVLLEAHSDLAGVDLAHFTFEMDEAVGEISSLVSTIFESTPAGN